MLRAILNISTGRTFRAVGAGLAVLALHIVVGVVAARIVERITD